jgi:hypothetical protein
MAAVPALLAMVLSFGAAQAQSSTTPTATPTPASDATTATVAATAGPVPLVGNVRPFRLEFGFRGRYMSVPDSILDFWYFDQDGDEADPSPLPRPRVRGYALGAEFVLRKNPSNWIFYGEYGGNLLEGGYWDDIEEPAAHDDGDYIVAEGFGIVIFGANYAHEITATPWLGFQFGGGLGVAFATGHLTQWNHGSDTGNTDPDCYPQSAAYERYEQGCAADGDKRVPTVVPMVDINASARFNFTERAHLRIEGGLHDLLYAGMAVGAVF